MALHVQGSRHAAPFVQSEDVNCGTVLLVRGLRWTGHMDTVNGVWNAVGDEHTEIMVCSRQHCTEEPAVADFITHATRWAQEDGNMLDALKCKVSKLLLA